MSLVLNCQQGYRSVTGVTKSVIGVTKSVTGVTKSVTNSVTGDTKVSLQCYQLHKNMINLGLLFCWFCSIGHR